MLESPDVASLLKSKCINGSSIDSYQYR